MGRFLFDASSSLNSGNFFISTFRIKFIYSNGNFERNNFYDAIKHTLNKRYEEQKKNCEKMISSQQNVV